MDIVGIELRMYTLEFQSLITVFNLRNTWVTPQTIIYKRICMYKAMVLSVYICTCIAGAYMLLARYKVFCPGLCALHMTQQICTSMQQLPNIYIYIYTVRTTLCHISFESVP